MLALLGLTIAGAGIMKSESAISKQKEQIQADSLAQAQLASAKAQQNASANVNWATNQTMQANAYQRAYNSVSQSFANQEFWAGYITWKVAVRLAEEKKRKDELAMLIKAKLFSPPQIIRRVPQAYLVALNTTVTITYIDTQGNSNYSLGTIANYNGQQVLVTHDHISDSANPPDTCNSLNSIQSNYTWMHIHGALDDVIINTADLNVLCRGLQTGVTFLSLKSGGNFNVTPMEAQINFNYNPTIGDRIYYSYIPSRNDQWWLLSNQDLQLPLNLANPFVVPLQQFSEVDIKEEMITRGISGREIIIEYGSAGQGDSGGGLFNTDGELVGVFQSVVNKREYKTTGVFWDDVRNIGFNVFPWSHPEPSAMDIRYHIIP